MDFKKEEYYEKCRALISVLSFNGFSDEDRSALLWILTDMFEKLGDVIGTTQKR